MTVTRLCFELDNGTSTIDLAREMSKALRTAKLHQKQIYTVLGGVVVGKEDTPNKVELATAPNTWYTQAAVNRCFKAWKHQRHSILADAQAHDKMIAKYSDFKVLLNGQNTNTLIKAKTFKGSGSRLALDNEDWDYTQLRDHKNPSTPESERYIQIMGNHSATRYSAMKGWIQVMPKPIQNEPTMIDIDSDNAGTAGAGGGADYEIDFINNLMFDEDPAKAGNNQLDMIVQTNDEAPYELLAPYGSDLNSDNNLVSQYMCWVSKNAPTHMIPGFKALCGLIEVYTDASDDKITLYLDVLNTPERF